MKIIQKPYMSSHAKVSKLNLSVWTDQYVCTFDVSVK